MSSDKDKTIAEIEAELAIKRKALESPFAAVGNVKPGPRRGRPPKIESAIGENVSEEVAFSQRMQGITRPPPNSSSESVRDWAEKEIHNLLPEAVASLAWDIRYGDSKARTEARGEILRATGIDKKDAASFGRGGQIVIQVNGNATGDLALPYLQRTSTEQKPTSPIVTVLEAEHKGKKG
jgi:hypothetical protein